MSSLSTSIRRTISLEKINGCLHSLWHFSVLRCAFRTKSFERNLKCVTFDLKDRIRYRSCTHCDIIQCWRLKYFISTTMIVYIIKLVFPSLRMIMYVLSFDNIIFNSVQHSSTSRPSRRTPPSGLRSVSTYRRVCESIVF